MVSRHVIRDRDIFVVAAAVLNRNYLITGSIDRSLPQCQWPPSPFLGLSRSLFLFRCRVMLVWAQLAQLKSILPTSPKPTARKSIISVLVAEAIV